MSVPRMRYARADRPGEEFGSDGCAGGDAEVEESTTCEALALIVNVDDASLMVVGQFGECHIGLLLDRLIVGSVNVNG